MSVLSESPEHVPVVEEESFLTNLHVLLEFLRNRTDKENSPFKWEVMASQHDKLPMAGYRQPFVNWGTYTGFLLGRQDLFINIDSLC